MTDSKSKIKIAENILQNAKQNDRNALDLMFQQFIGTEEKVQFAEYMGQYGIILFVEHSFACVTEKRVISLNVGSFGEILYQDAYLEDFNSGAIFQPSIFWLYVLTIILVIFTFGIGILAIPFLVKMYYKIFKCGLVFIIKQGLSVYVFANRNKLVRALELYRVCSKLREIRVRSLDK